MGVLNNCILHLLVCVCRTGKASDLANQLVAAKQNAESAKQELSDYKEKAARILQVHYVRSHSIHAC
jgi:hypothetical protein